MEPRVMMARGGSPCIHVTWPHSALAESGTSLRVWWLHSVSATAARARRTSSASTWSRSGSGKRVVFVRWAPAGTMQHAGASARAIARGDSAAWPLRCSEKVSVTAARHLAGCG